jgi:hypothetical protein
MKLNIVMATATAVSALLIGQVLAADDDNFARVKQAGTSNEISIEQDGASNRAGANYSDWAVGQDGRFNTISLLQDGNSNLFGNTHNLAGLHGSYSFNGIPAARVPEGTIWAVQGVNQVGDRNAIGVIQTGNGNRIYGVKQESIKNNDGVTHTANRLTITQTGPAGVTAHNGVGDVRQKNDVLVNSASLTNAITITQTGGASTSGNLVYKLVQDGSGNNIDLVQSGLKNIVTSILQDGTTNDVDIQQTAGNGNWVGAVTQRGTINTLEVIQTGSGNEVVSVSQNNEAGGTQGNQASLKFTGSFNGVGTLTGPAEDVSLTLATVVQLGDKNALTHTVTGDNNLFAFSQIDNNNTILSQVTGNNNQIAVSQTGGSNYAHAQQNGGGNNVGIIQ